MSDDLLTLTRKHDLPPRWDGLAVLWHGWEANLRTEVFICPPPKDECCTSCGSLTISVRNRGLVAKWAAFTVDDLINENQIRARLGTHAYKRKPRGLWRLFAFRCPDCKHDVIWDTDTNEWWDLDHTDYGDEGSH